MVQQVLSEYASVPFSDRQSDSQLIFDKEPERDRIIQQFPL